MQTSFAIASSQFGQAEQGIAASLLPRVLERENPQDSRRNITSFEFATRAKDRRLAASEKIEESIAYMTRNVNRPLQVSTLASLVNISPSHYFALFKRHTGRAPMDYFTRLRMEKARCLLDTTASSVKEVAAALGYDDPFYFSRVFKSVNRLAPSNYRVKQKLENEPGENSPCES
jgi:transcriptional regulator GlxA family with amidase domain